MENLESWFDDYTTRRYGRPSPLAAQAWKTLIPEVLNSTLKETVSILTEMPNTNQTDLMAYEIESINDAWDLMVMAVEKDSDLGLQATFK